MEQLTTPKRSGSRQLSYDEHGRMPASINDQQQLPPQQPLSQYPALGASAGRDHKLPPKSLHSYKTAQANKANRKGR